LREACYSDFADRLVIVEYDMLTQRPQDVFKLLYDFLGEDPFAHDFDNVAYDAPTFDAQLGLDGLHRVRPKVEPAPRPTILPPDLFERYSTMAFWRDLKGSKAFRLIAQPHSAEPSGARSKALPTPVPQ
jgi:sulfotransferase